MGIDQPIWLLESYLADGWHWLTGTERTPLRYTLLSVSTVTYALSFISPLPLLTGATTVLVILVAIRWFRWPSYMAPMPDGYKFPAIRFMSSLIHYWGAFTLLAGMASGSWMASATGIGSMCMALSDFVLWADHMDKPLRKRNTVSDVLRRLVEAMNSPQPVTDH